MFSFRKRQKYVDAAPFIRRIIDRTTVAQARLAKRRTQNRYVRSLALLMAPWIDGAPDMERLTFGVTKDLSDTGMSVITTREFPTDVVFAFLLDSEITDRVLCFRAESKRQLKLVEGIVEYGYLIQEMLNEKNAEAIDSFAKVVSAANQQLQTMQA